MLGVSPAVAQSPNSDFTANYLFSYLTVDNGLPNNFVDAIYKDSHGFMWICTMGGGLVKHDGYNFVHFNNRSDYQIKSNYVHSVCEDNFDRLWIATENGVNIMDLSTYGAAKSLTDSCINVNGINNTTIFKIVKDS
jgi:ligand-binding sensor domain-containing protein